jgi:hypothetical protein
LLIAARTNAGVGLGRILPLGDQLDLGLLRFPEPNACEAKADLKKESGHIAHHVSSSSFAPDEAQAIASPVRFERSG